MGRIKVKFFSLYAHTKDQVWHYTMSKYRLFDTSAIIIMGYSIVLRKVNSWLLVLGMVNNSIAALPIYVIVVNF